MFIREGNTEQCQAEVIFDREVEGCVGSIAEMEGMDWEGLQRSSRD